jgi:uncharacterized protein (TIGR02271 family)
MKENFVPLGDATLSGGTLSVPYDKEKIKNSPGVDADDDRITPDEEAELYRYYGLPYQPWTGRAGPEDVRDVRTGGQVRETERTGERWTGEPAEQRTRERTDDAMTRSEERLEVGTQRQEAGRVRLRKYVVTEEEQQAVPVRRERVRVEREPITESNVDAARSGPDISEAEAEVTLHEERPVVEKRVEPVERVRLAKDEVTTEETVSEPVRKERIETEGEGAER